jgi:hypothetical protein
MDSTTQKIFSRIEARKPGWVFSPVDFLDLGNRAAIDQSLSRFVKKGKIRRLARGIYEYPRRSERFGILPPIINNVALAMARSTGSKIQLSEVSAANILGLTTQVPAKVVFYTDGTARTRKIGNQTIIFKRTTPKKLVGAGTMSGLVIQALRYYGKERITDSLIDRIRQKLSQAEIRQLMYAKTAVPVWIQKVIDQLTDQV